MPVFSALSAMENWYLSQWNSSVSFTLQQGRPLPTMEASSSPGLNIHANSSPLRYPAPNRKPGSAYPETPSSAGNPSSLHLAGHKTIIRPLLPAFPRWYNHPKGTYAGKEVFFDCIKQELCTHSERTQDHPDRYNQRIDQDCDRQHYREGQVYHRQGNKASSHTEA